MAVELLPPQLRSIPRAYQVNLHRQAVASLHDFTRQHRADAQILSHFGNVDW